MRLLPVRQHRQRSSPAPVAADPGYRCSVMPGCELQWRRRQAMGTSRGTSLRQSAARGRSTPSNSDDFFVRMRHQIARLSDISLPRLGCKRVHFHGFFSSRTFFRIPWKSGRNLRTIMALERVYDPEGHFVSRTRRVCQWCAARQTAICGGPGNASSV